MKESKAVLLGFGAVAFAIVVVPLGFLFYGSHAMNEDVANVDGPISRAFLNVDVGSSGSPTPVPNLDALLPLGKPRAAALGDLGKEGFACSPKEHGAICLRSVNHGSASESWTVILTFDANDRIASLSGSTQAKSL